MTRAMAADPAAEATAPPRQLDLFDDSPLNQLLHEVYQALLRWDLAQAAYRLGRAPDAPGVQRTRELLALAQRFATALAEPQAAARCLHKELEPALRQDLGARAVGLLNSLKTRLARALQLVPFLGQPDEAHAAPLWLELAQPQQAIASIEQDWLWRECPQRLSWHAFANEALLKHAPALLDWGVLAVNFPEAAETALADSRLLGAAWLRFADLDTPVPTRWFPLWCVLGERLGWPADDVPLRDPAARQAWSGLRRVLATSVTERRSPDFRLWLRSACDPGLQQLWLR